MNDLNKTDKFCICPDEEVTKIFNLKANSFDTENGLRITVEVLYTREYNHVITLSV
jgi:hypothetical protein